MNNNLPVISTFLEALSFPYKYHQALLKVGFPVIIVGAALIILNHFFPDSNENSILAILTIILEVAFYLFLVIAIIGCHRIFLLDKNSVEKPSFLNWTGNEVKYIGWWILIGLFTSLVAVPFMLILTPFILLSVSNISENQFIISAITLGVTGIIVIPIYYVASRWSLVLPSSAIDRHGKSLTWSWELSSGNDWRLTLLIGFLPFIMDMIFSQLPLDDSIFLSLFYGVSWLVLGVVEIGLLSLSYKFLVANEVIENSKE